MDLGAAIDVIAISPEAPCGPDMSGEADFLNFIVRAENLFPASFYSRVDSTPFDRTSVDLESECKAGDALGRTTHDLRVLIPLIKLNALNRDARKTVDLVVRIAGLLEHHWDALHPRAEDGDYSYRMATLQALDDNTHIVLPLQYSPVLTLPRVGPVSTRTLLLASGALTPREGEQAPDATPIERGFHEADIELVRDARNVYARLVTALDQIRAVWLDRAGYDQAVRFDLVLPFATKARDAFEKYVAQRDGPVAGSGADQGGDAGAAGTVADPGAPAGSATSVSTFGDAEKAMSTAADYFARREPSNPALPLIRQAQQLMGKSFLDVLRIIAPEHVDTSNLQIGKGPYLPFPIGRLAEFSELPGAEGLESEPKTFEVKSRQEAVGLLGKVNAFYAIHEPSSPLPLFTERAIALAGRDFFGIIRDILPEDALKDVEKKLS